MRTLQRFAALAATAILILAAGAAPGLAETHLARDGFFRHFGTPEGLPDRTVWSLMEDRRGFLWVGTHNGLSRFDGYSFKTFRPDEDDSTAIAGRTIAVLHEDVHGTIWIGSKDAGLSSLDPETGIFTNYNLTAGGHGKRAAIPIDALTSTSDGTVWVAMRGAGIQRIAPGRGHLERVLRPDEQVTFASRDSILALEAMEDDHVWMSVRSYGVRVHDLNNRSWRSYPFGDGKAGTVPATEVMDIHQDRTGRVWLATDAGLLLWDVATDSFQEHLPFEDKIWEKYLVRISEDARGDLWIASPAGMYRFDSDARTFDLHRHDPQRENSMARGWVLSVLCDAAGTVWVGGWHAGLGALDTRRGDIHVLRHDPLDPGSLEHDHVRSFTTADDGTMFIGTGGLPGEDPYGTVHRLRPGEDTFYRIKGLPEDPIGAVTDLAISPEGEVFIGMPWGLYSIAPGADQARKYEFRERMATQIDGVSVYAMTFDPDGALWVGTLWDGIFRINRRTGDVRQYLQEHDPGAGPSQNSVNSLYYDRSGRLWVGTPSSGLERLDPRTGTFTPIVDAGIALTTITDILQTPDGDTWVATGAGLLVVRPDDTVEVVHGQNGELRDTGVASLVLDEAGRIWAHTVRGIMRLDPESRAVRIFDEEEGIPGGELYCGSGRGRDGRLYFGSTGGLVVVDPTSVEPPLPAAPVAITSLDVNDRPWAELARERDEKILPYVDELVLGHVEHDLDFTFAALDVGRARNHRYRYRLEGADHDWRSPEGGNRARYINLRPGRYRFVVQQAEPSGGWDAREASVMVVIRPPWWNSDPARFLYVAAALGLIVFIFRQVINRERMRAALEVERAEARQFQEIDQLKTDFFANISHEFRTPLTLILGPLRRLQATAEGDEREYCTMIERNARWLRRLIEQILDISRLEAGRLPLHWQTRNWGRSVAALASTFESHAADRGVAYEVRGTDTGCTGWFDPGLLEKVVANLLSNAFKFTPEGGRISFEMACSTSVEPLPIPAPGKSALARPAAPARTMSLTVHNTGSYIPPEDREAIFDRFRQLSDQGESGRGSGIGLALVREIVERMEGVIRMESDPETGTVFRVDLPVFVENPDPVTPPRDLAEERADTSPGEYGEVDLARSSELPEEGGHESGDEEQEPGTPDDQPRVLVIEDNDDMRQYLTAELGVDYHLVEAPDGEKGLATAVEEVPDLVVSDVMMPGLDGFEVCRRLKGDEQTSHIPVILLTARTGAGSRREGLDSGADDYLDKPFDMEELKLRIRNQIESRRRLRERFAGLLELGETTAMPVVSADERFLKRAREVVEEHLDDSDFTVDALTAKMGMSRTQLFCKLKALTGQAPQEFIRNIRLQQAAHLLRGGYGNVTEVVYRIGMQSLSTFSRRFREKFGESPSEYARKHRDKDKD